jgi:hypothetical protein
VDDTVTIKAHLHTAPPDGVSVAFVGCSTLDILAVNGTTTSHGCHGRPRRLHLRVCRVFGPSMWSAM